MYKQRSSSVMRMQESENPVKHNAESVDSGDTTVKSGFHQDCCAATRHLPTNVARRLTDSDHTTSTKKFKAYSSCNADKAEYDSSSSYR